MSLRDRLSGLLDKKRLTHAVQPPPIPYHNKPSPSSAFRESDRQSTLSPRLPAQPPIYWAPAFDPQRPVSGHFIHKTGGDGWGNNELQNYVPHSSNSFFTPDHRLVVRAIASSASAPDAKYTSARLVTRQTLGRDQGFLFARLTAPCARGVWPALWLLPQEPFTWPGDGEIDVFEAWDGKLVNHACLHWGQHNGEDWDKHRVVETDIPRLLTPFGLVVGLAWEQSQDGDKGWLVWYIDGRPVMRATCPSGMRRMRDFTVVINVAMGGVVCGGNVPADGIYDLVVHELKMFEAPFGGWEQFLRDWAAAPEGRRG